MKPSVGRLSCRWISPKIQTTRLMPEGKDVFWLVSSNGSSPRSRESEARPEGGLMIVCLARRQRTVDDWRSR